MLQLLLGTTPVLWRITEGGPLPPASSSGHSVMSAPSSGSTFAGCVSSVSSALLPLPTRRPLMSQLV